MKDGIWNLWRPWFALLCSALLDTALCVFFSVSSLPCCFAFYILQQFKYTHTRHTWIYLFFFCVCHSLSRFIHLVLSFFLRLSSRLYLTHARRTSMWIGMHFFSLLHHTCMCIMLCVAVCLCMSAGILFHSIPVSLSFLFSPSTYHDSACVEKFECIQFIKKKAFTHVYLRSVLTRFLVLENRMNCDRAVLFKPMLQVSICE